MVYDVHVLPPSGGVWYNGSMTCNHCGQVFEGRSDAKYCKKQDCQTARRRGHKPRPRVDHEEIPCEKCGAYFKPSKKGVRFCKIQECVASRNKAKDKRRRGKQVAEFGPSTPYLMKRYGITEEQRDRMVEVAGGCCEICGRTDALVVDHDHASGALRGILCRVCNLAIGNLGDTADSVKRAYEYLQQAELGRVFFEPGEPME